eukprot:6529537-Prorocentrum_lima.AAC.1
MTVTTNHAATSAASQGQNYSEHRALVIKLCMVMILPPSALTLQRWSLCFIRSSMLASYMVNYAWIRSNVSYCA